MLLSYTSILLSLSSSVSQWRRTLALWVYLFFLYFPFFTAYATRLWNCASQFLHFFDDLCASIFFTNELFGGYALFASHSFIVSSHKNSWTLSLCTFALFDLLVFTSSWPIRFLALYQCVVLLDFEAHIYSPTNRSYLKLSVFALHLPPTFSLL